MKKQFKKNLGISMGLLLAFVLWTLLIRFIDVKTIGPKESAVGFATLNGFFHNLTGVNFTLYTITDWLGLVPVFVCFGFGLLGLIQLIKRKSLLKVDFSLRVLGGFYIVVMAAYIFFEFFVVNYRPVLIDGFLEASYPSSTTLLVLCIMPTALMQLNSRVNNDILRKIITVSITVFIIFMVIGRLISGVHWLTDIIGGALLSAGLVMMYRSISNFIYCNR